jgi:UDP-GlcNAc:undecaprenyl-phosphate/decaprenyl-phosphate GlcNAc-1-phosphate transferase
MHYLPPFVLALAAALIASPCAARLAACVGAIDKPGIRRIHSKPTPRLGGLAVLGALIAAVALTVVFDDSMAHALAVDRDKLVGIALGATMLAVIGAIDDCKSVRPSIKLLVELLAVGTALASGCCDEAVFFTSLGWLSVPASLLWVTALINAVNMIDGLDGLAAGVCFIAGAVLFGVSVGSGNVFQSVLLAALCGALLGFLRYNFHPAKIFLGDSGSLVLGFLLSITAITSFGKTATTVAVLAPCLALGLPIAEITLTALRRSLRVIRTVRIAKDESSAALYKLSLIRNPRLLTADADHIHHRLLASGIGHRTAVLVLYGVSAVSAALALVLTVWQVAAALVMVGVVFTAALLEIYYLDYRELRLIRNGLLLPFLQFLDGERKLVLAVLDGLLPVASLTGAYFAYYGASIFTKAYSALWLPLLAVMLAQAIALRIGGLYRYTTRHPGLTDLLGVIKAVAFAATVGWALQFAIITQHPPQFSIVLILLDSYLLLTLVIASRLSFSVADYLFRSQKDGTPALIYGTGEDASAAFHRAQWSSKPKPKIIGFIDEGLGRRKTLLHGLPVYSPEELRDLIANMRIDEVIIATDRLSTARLKEINTLRAMTNIHLKHFSSDFFDYAPSTDGTESRYELAGLRARLDH